MNWSTRPGVRPSQPPNQSPVQPMIETTHCGSGPSRPEAYSTRGATLRVVGEEVRGSSAGPRPRRRRGRPPASPCASAGRARLPNPPGVVTPSQASPAVLEDPQGIRHVVGELVGRLAVGPAPVLHEPLGPLGEGPAGLRVDDPGVADHLGVDVPVGHHQRADQIEALVQLAARPAGQVAVEPADAGGVGDDAVLALDPLLVAPLAELADEGVGDLARERLPGLSVAVGEDLWNCGMAKWARFTRQVESSMIRLTGTRPRGLSTSTPSGLSGRAPASCAGGRARGRRARPRRPPARWRGGTGGVMRSSCDVPPGHSVGRRMESIHARCQMPDARW